MLEWQLEISPSSSPFMKQYSVLLVLRQHLGLSVSYEQLEQLACWDSINEAFVSIALNYRQDIAARVDVFAFNLVFGAGVVPAISLYPNLHRLVVIPSIVTTRNALAGSGDDDFSAILIYPVLHHLIDGVVWLL